MKINKDIVPSTVEKAVDLIVDALAEEDINYIKQHSSESIHLTIGQYIRNSWSLWYQDTPLKRDAVHTYKIAHADDISGLIFEWVWHKVLEKEFDPIKHCEIFHLK